MRRHHDANQIYKLLVAREIAAMIEREPALVASARAALERLARAPHSDAAVEAWTDLLSRPIDAIAAELGRDDEAGDYLRESMPGFVALPASLRSQLSIDARLMAKAERR